MDSKIADSPTEAASCHQASTPAPRPLRNPSAVLPEDILDTALVLALRQAGVMDAYAQADRAIHQAGMRVTISRDLTNIRLGVKLLASSELPPDEIADASTAFSPAAVTTTASAALHALWHIGQFTNLRGKGNAPSGCELGRDLTLADRAACIRDMAHAPFEETVLGPHFQVSMDFLKEKFVNLLKRDLAPWAARAYAAGGQSYRASDRIIEAIYSDSKSPLDLKNLNLDSLPLLHQYLPNLTHLRLSRNRFSKIPDSVRGLNRLIALDVRLNSLSSLDLTPLQLAQLTHLDICSTRIPASGANICQLTALQSFDMSINIDRNVPSSIKNLVNLKSLSARNNNLSSLPAELWELRELESLDLKSNKLPASQIHAYKLPKLRILELNLNLDLQYLPPHTENITTLEILRVGDCRIKEIPSDLSNLKSLKEFDLSGSSLNFWPLSLQQIAGLEKLYLNFNFDLPQPKGLAFWGHATGYYLHQLNSLMGFGNSDLQNWNPWLFPVEFCDFKELTHLDISATNTIGLPSQIARLQKLRELKVAGTRITHLAPEVGELKALRVLDLSSTKIASLPGTLSQLQSLEEMDLSHTSIPAIDEWFCQLKALRLIWCRRSAHADLALGPIKIPAALRERQGLTILE